MYSLLFKKIFLDDCFFLAKLNMDMIKKMIGLFQSLVDEEKEEKEQRRFREERKGRRREGGK